MKSNQIDLPVKTFLTIYFSFLLIMLVIVFCHLKYSHFILLPTVVLQHHNHNHRQIRFQILLMKSECMKLIESFSLIEKLINDLIKVCNKFMQLLITVLTHVESTKCNGKDFVLNPTNLFTHILPFFRQ